MSLSRGNGADPCAVPAAPALLGAVRL